MTARMHADELEIDVSLARWSASATPTSCGCPAAGAVWDAALRAPPWEQRPVWIHGDLDARNTRCSFARRAAGSRLA